MFVLDSPSFDGWTVTVWPETGSATFAASPKRDDHTARHGLPRVWPGRGLGIPEHGLPGLCRVLAEIMKTPAYWAARQRWHEHNLGRTGEVCWSHARHDPDDDFVYLSGPCGDFDGSAGYRPATVFTLPLAEVRGLRIRFNAYLSAVAEAH